ncbi:hypothetical protein BU15DRAFT_77108 [Melanogaster broomeanus]|nr:hypothetical protein BU15DRAFT_77108 [Melanogaster broomeanus]
MSAEEQAKTKLAHDVDRWRSVAKALELERDELKDVVEDLIEKVQISNEWSSWPCSRMRITKHAEQVTGGTDDVGPATHKCNDDLLAYATSIIARLRMELDFERKGHTRTTEEANLHTEELEAKVAVREAELEACIHHHVGKQEPDTDTPPTLGKWVPGRKLPPPKAISDEECLHFLESNNARNRSLELEIRGIAEKLEQAMIAASIPSEPRKESLKDAQQSVPEDELSGTTNTSGGASVPNTLSASPGEARLPVGDNSLAPESPFMMLSIAQLDHHIRTMTAQTDALKAERTTLVETAARHRRVTTGSALDSFPDVLQVEEECVRLLAQVSDLQEQLDHTRTSARMREEELLQEIEQLRAVAGQSSPRLYNIYTPRPLEDDIAAEECMELATPLQPTITLSSHTPIIITTATAQRTDPLLVPLPFSPERVSSPVASPRASRNPGGQDIVGVEEALVAARARLAEKEELLAELRVDMERLRRQVRPVDPEDELSRWI